MDGKEFDINLAEVSEVIPPSIKFALSLAHFDIREIRNFACRYEFMRAKPFSKAFSTLALSPFDSALKSIIPF